MIENKKIETIEQIKADDFVKQMKYFSIKPRIHERNQKPNILLRGLSEEMILTAEKELASEIAQGNVKFHESKVVSEAKPKTAFSTKSISFEIKKYDKKLHDEYCKYRKMDMQQDMEEIEGLNSNTPSLYEINFKHSVIGSDETGKGELLKPLVVTAAYLDGTKEHDKCIEFGVYDSKAIGTKVNVIGKAFTGFENLQDDFIRMAIEKREPIVSDFLAIRIITNEELNEACEKKYAGQEIRIEGVVDELLKDAHKEVICALYEKHPNATIVIDDFTDGKGSELKKEFVAKNIQEENIYLTTKGDAKITAVGLASDISYYISELWMKDLEEVFLKEYSEEQNVKLLSGSPNSSIVKKFLEKIKAEKREEFLSKYVKRYYANVTNALS